MKRILLITLFLSLAGCSSLGILVVNDTLTASQHNDLGFAYEEQGKLKLAEKEYRLAIKKEKGPYLPYFNLGNVYFKLSELDQSIKYYRAALKRNPENPDIMNNLAYALLKNGDYLEARDLIEKAITVAAKPEYLDTRDQIRLKLPENQR
jgi:Tfp pilus assembly protein PilF